MKTFIFCVFLVTVSGRHLGEERVSVRELGSNDQANPEELTIQLHRRGSHLKTLSLKRRDDLNLDAPVFTVKRDGSLEPTATKALDAVPYQDRDNGASFFVKSVRTAGGAYERSLRGMIVEGDYESHLEPTITSRRRSIEDGVEHVMVTKRMEKGVYDHGPVIRNVLSKRGDNGTISKRGDNGTISKRGDNGTVASMRDESVFVSKREATPYTIELLLVADYVAFKRFKDAEMAKYYYAYLAQSLDLLYRNIKADDFSYCVKLTGYIFFDSAEASITTKEASEGKLKAYNGLYEFDEWRTKKLSELPKHDHGMLMTGFNLYDQNPGSTNLVGLANGGTICGERPTSIVEDQGGYRSASTGAHEMGHNLGVLNHDGEFNTCRKDDKFIMAAECATPADNIKNTFNWSPCSVDQLRAKLKKLNDAGKNCLKNSATSIPPELTKAPGQLWGPDAQCQRLSGAKSKFVGGGDVKNICRQLDCTVPNDPSSATSAGGALRGTTCGNKKWCFEADCVYDEKAPEAKEDCLFGDSNLAVGVNQELCPQEIAKKSGQCYMDSLRKKCCKSCADLKDESKPDCPYGDKSIDCKESPTPNGCNFAYYRKICCGTCPKVGIKPCDDTDDFAPKLKDGSKGTCAQVIAEDPKKCEDFEVNSTCCKSCTVKL